VQLHRGDARLLLSIQVSSLTQTIAGRYKDSNSRVDVKIFEGKSHFICGEPGWEKVADFILDWYENL
jgi:hypothetical protein